MYPRILSFGCLIALFVSSILACAADGAKSYSSPDKTIRVEVSSCEHGTVIKLSSREGRELQLIDSCTSGSFHNIRLVKAEWSRNSRFFVFSATAGAGNKRLFFYDGNTNIVYDLADALRGTFTGDFKFEIFEGEEVLTAPFQSNEKYPVGGSPLTLRINDVPLIIRDVHDSRDPAIRNKAVNASFSFDRERAISLARKGMAEAVRPGTPEDYALDAPIVRAVNGHDCGDPKPIIAVFFPSRTDSGYFMTAIWLEGQEMEVFGQMDGFAELDHILDQLAFPFADPGSPCRHLD